MRKSMNKIAIKDCDIIFLSYDEPNADKNYADLKKKMPWAKRVHGIFGSDTAHKACAALSDTEYFVTVDGDTQLDEKFINLVIDLDSMGMDNSYIFSWCGHIDLNGLKYGNGSIKLWTRTFVNEMKTHENYQGKDRNLIEFCYFDKLFQFNENYSTSYINSTPKQAWRAGFREGVKMSIAKDSRVKDYKTLWWQNYHRLIIWMTVGMDVENGIWAIAGAREGCYRTICTDWNISLTRDFKYLDQTWSDFSQQISQNQEKCLERIKDLGKEILKKQSMELPVEPLTAEQSKFFKKVYINSPRVLRKTI